jgi:hypothetical protein
VTRKVIRFLRDAPAADRWAGALARPGAPSRATIATAIELPGLPPPRFAAVEVLWFHDGPPPDGHPGTGSGSETEADRGGAGLPAGAGAMVVAVDEVVARGAEALVHRWAEGGERLKMMSFGRRNPALTRASFVERWRAEAGRLGGDRIPDDLRGFAYVQDHPLGDDPPLDAVNEVWFDRLDDLRRRADWFAVRPVPEDLMSPAECWSLYLREVVVGP